MSDMPTQFGSPIYQGHQSCFDSSAVAILRDAGALILGLPTYVLFHSDRPNFSYRQGNYNRTPGGFSCGSAAAVADIQVPLCLGTQTGGSVIRPASYTGILAMKLTYNAILLEGQKTCAPTFDTFRFFARTSDIQLLADVFDLKDDEAPNDVPLDQISVAIVKTPMWSQAGPSTKSAIEQALSILESKSVEVEELSFPSSFLVAEMEKRVQKTIINTEVQMSFLREYRENKAGLALEIQHIVENKANYTHKDATEASDFFDEVRHVMNRLSQKYSVILTPSVADEDPLGLENMGSATFNRPWTVSVFPFARTLGLSFPCLTHLTLGFHMPVIKILAFIGAHGLPVGVSPVAPRHHDQHTLKMSKILGDAFIAEGTGSSR